MQNSKTQAKHTEEKVKRHHLRQWETKGWSIGKKRNFQTLNLILTKILCRQFVILHIRGI